MVDPGLQEAIRAVGGVTELARRIGISQPSVSNWSKIPAERVLAVEAASGIGRATLRPDLYAEDIVDEVDRARANEYALLARLLTRAPDPDLLERLAGLRGDATPLGVARVELAQAAKDADPGKTEREYFDQIGRARRPPPYSSGWPVCAATRLHSALPVSNWRKPRKTPILAKPNANTSICSSASGAASCCPKIGRASCR